MDQPLDSPESQNNTIQKASNADRTVRVHGGVDLESIRDMVTAISRSNYSCHITQYYTDL